MNIIILGHINSGKSETAKYIQEKYGYTIYSLGDGVKNFIVDMFAILHEINPEKYETIELNDLYNRDTKEDYRKHMQLIATDLCRRYFGSDVWINYLKQKLIYSSKYIIDDIRFKSEYEAFKHSAVSIRLIRDCELSSNHISEHELDDIVANYNIINNGSINDLHLMIDKIMREISANFY